MQEANTTAHLEHVPIPAERWARWTEAAAALGEAGHALRIELADVANDPTRHMIARAAKAARFAERQSTGNLAMVANATATELEESAL